MGIFKRFFKIGEANVNTELDKKEDPIKMIKQSVRDLKQDLSNSMEGLVEVKTITNRSRTDLAKKEQLTLDYQRKATLLIQRAKDGKININEADRLATEALKRKEKFEADIKEIKKRLTKYESQEKSIQTNVDKLKGIIDDYEFDLSSLKSRLETAKVAKNINMTLAKIDSMSPIAKLEEMKDKIAQVEASVDAYQEIIEENVSIDNEIDEALKDEEKESLGDQLERLKNSLPSKEQEG